MSEQTGQFRSAAFGGFHRQDVLDYLERLAQEKQELTNRLTDESEARTQAEAGLAKAEQEAAAIREAQEAMSAELDYLRKELEVRSASLALAEEEIKVLRAQAEALRPGAESWEHLKEQAGSIELSAHERAQVTIQDAHAQAADIQAEGMRWVLEIQRECQRVQADLEVSLQSAEQQLDVARNSFQTARKEVTGYQEALDRLLAGIKTEDDAETEELIES